jgi:hypothetical protein
MTMEPICIRVMITTKEENVSITIATDEHEANLPMTGDGNEANMTSDEDEFLRAL